MDRGAAEDPEVVAQRVPRRAPRLGDGEGDEVPATVPVVPVEVLVVGLQGAVAHGRQGPETVVGGPVDGALTAPLAHEEALG